MQNIKAHYDGLYPSVSRLWLPLETRSHDGCKVIYGRLVDYEPKKFNFSDDCRLVA